MEAELGRPIAEVFSSISERPIAAASLGQVRVLAAAPAQTVPKRAAVLAQLDPLLYNEISRVSGAWGTAFKYSSKQRRGCIGGTARLLSEQNEELTGASLHSKRECAKSTA